MQQLKKYLGLVWMALGPIAIAILIWGAANNISATGTGDINKPLPWVIIIAIFTPIAIGLSVFGWYAWGNEYNPAAHPNLPGGNATGAQPSLSDASTV